MIVDRCLTPDELARASELPPDHPQRRHLDTCPRCRAQLLTYREFLEDRSVPETADLPDGEGRLRAAFQKALESQPADAWREAPRESFRGIRVWLRQAARPVVLVPAAAVALLVVGLYAGLEHFRGNIGPDQLRGSATSDGGEGQGEVQLLDPIPRGAGGIELRWHAEPGISSYEVVIFGASLQDLARIGPIPDTTCTVRREDLRPEQPAETVLGWQVIAMRDGAPAAKSTISTVRLP